MSDATRHGWRHAQEHTLLPLATNTASFTPSSVRHHLLPGRGVAHKPLPLHVGRWTKLKTQSSRLINVSQRRSLITLFVVIVTLL